MEVNDLTDAGFTLFRPGTHGYNGMAAFLNDHRGGDAYAVSLLYGEAGPCRWWLGCTSNVAMKRMLLHSAPTALCTRGVAAHLGMPLANVRRSISCANENLQDERISRLFYDIEDSSTGANAGARAGQFIDAVRDYGTSHWNEFTGCSRHRDVPVHYTHCTTCRMADIASGAFVQRIVFNASSAAKMSFHITFPFIVFADLAALKRAVGEFTEWLTRHRRRYPLCFRGATRECIVDESFYAQPRSMRMPTMSKIGSGNVLVRPLVFAPEHSYISASAPLTAADVFELGTVQLFVRQHVQGGHVWSIAAPYRPYRIHGDNLGRGGGARSTASRASTAAGGPQGGPARAQLSVDAQSHILDYLLTPERLGACWDRETVRYVPKVGFYWTFRVDGSHPQFCPGMAVRRFDGWARGEKPVIERNRCVYLPRGTLPKRLIEKRASYTHRKTSDVSIMVTSDGKVLAFCHEKCCAKGVCIHGPDAVLAALYGQFTASSVGDAARPRTS